MNTVRDTIIKFLEIHGFKSIDVNSFSNNKCIVNIKNHLNEDSCYYEIIDNTKTYMNNMYRYSDNENIFWLAGVLLWYGYIDELKPI
jgi:hypothetical protein